MIVKGIGKDGNESARYSEKAVFELRNYLTILHTSPARSALSPQQGLPNSPLQRNPLAPRRTTQPGTVRPVRSQIFYGLLPVAAGALAVGRDIRGNARPIKSSHPRSANHQAEEVASKNNDLFHIHLVPSQVIIIP